MPNPLNDQALNDPSNRVRSGPQPRTDWAALYYDERARHRDTLINDSEIIEVLHSKVRHRTHQVYTLLAFWCLLLILFLNALLFVK